MNLSLAQLATLCELARFGTMVAVADESGYTPCGVVDDQHAPHAGLSIANAQTFSGPALVHEFQDVHRHLTPRPRLERLP